MLHPDLGTRIVLIGNSGSGKSTLAQRIADRLALPVLDLDLIHWEGEGYGRKRDENAARALATQAAGGPRWIIEGVYGWLASAALPRAESLIWLDLPWSECRDKLIARGMRRGADPDDFAALLAWAEGYWTRTIRARSRDTGCSSIRSPVRNGGCGAEERFSSSSLGSRLQKPNPIERM
jgi:adenylate kinase family enzyme